MILAFSNGGVQIWDQIQVGIGKMISFILDKLTLNYLKTTQRRFPVAPDDVFGVQGRKLR